MQICTVTELFCRTQPSGCHEKLQIAFAGNYAVFGVELNTAKNKEMACAIQYLLIMDTYKTTPNNMVLRYTPPRQQNILIIVTVVNLYNMYMKVYAKMSIHNLISTVQEVYDNGLGIVFQGDQLTSLS